MNRLAAGLLALFLAAPLLAEMVAPPAVPFRVATADAVFVGKVTSIADKVTPAGLGKGDAREMRLATVVVSAPLVGRPGKNVEVGFLPFRRMAAGADVAKGDEFLFFARKHPTRKNTYVVDPYSGQVSGRAADYFKARVAEAKKAAAVFADPMAALKAKDARERGAAASLLVLRYKTPPGPGAKTETVPVAESKLILQALADGDWQPGHALHGEVSPRNGFAALNLADKDGWTPPKDLAKHADTARKWLKDKAGSYKLTRYIRGEGPNEEPPPK